MDIPTDDTASEPCGCSELRETVLARRAVLALTATAGLIGAQTLHGARVAFAASPAPSGTPSASPSATPSRSPSPSGSASPSPSVTPSRSPSPSRSASPSASPSASVSASASASPSATPSPSGSPSPSVLPGGRTPGGPVLVVVSLRGGFDGLSAVVPVADPGYRQARPDLAIPASLLQRADSRFGLAPGLAPLFPFWRSGRMAAVHAVGQQDPTRSHFEAMAELERAAPGSSLRTGWLDRSIGVLPGAGELAAAQVGSATMPAALYGEHPKFAVTGLSDLRVAVGNDLVPLTAWHDAFASLHKGARPDLVRPTTEAVSAVQRLAALPQAVDARAAGYPDGQFAAALHDVARLIKAGLGLRVATLDLGGWDMHQNLGRGDGGQMFDRLTELAGGLAAFATELGKDLDRVTVVTISEFGRRLAQNGSSGLDHGHGNVVLLLGGGVRGGQVYGRWPGLSASALDDGDLAATTDYRSVMSEVLRRIGVSDLRTVFPGFTPSPVGAVSA